MVSKQKISGTPGVRRPARLLLLLLLVQLAATQNSDCPHECVPPTQCPELMKLLHNPTPEQTEILRQATCSVRNNNPTVCCPKSTTSPPTSLLPEKCGQGSLIDRLIGGEVAPIGSYPWMAVFGYSGVGKLDFLCAGSVINERYVLTAAHCVTESQLKKQPLEVIRLGEWDLTTQKDCQVKNTGFIDCAPPAQDFFYEEIIVHPDFDTRGMSSDDIALIRLNQPIDLSGGSIMAICLPEQNLDVGSVVQNRQAVVAGWGITEKGTFSDKMLHVSLPMYDLELCNATYKGTVVKEQVCFGGREAEDTCKGDSGGPLLLSSPRGPPFLQIGVVSFGLSPCGQIHKPAVYTSVSHYRNWIEENLKP